MSDFRYFVLEEYESGTTVTAYGDSNLALGYAEACMRFNGVISATVCRGIVRHFRKVVSTVEKESFA